MFYSLGGRAKPFARRRSVIHVDPRLLAATFPTRSVTERLLYHIRLRRTPAREGRRMVLTTSKRVAPLSDLEAATPIGGCQRAQVSRRPPPARPLCEPLLCLLRLRPAAQPSRTLIPVMQNDRPRRDTTSIYWVPQAAIAYRLCSKFKALAGRSSVCYNVRTNLGGGVLCRYCCRSSSSS